MDCLGGWAYFRGAVGYFCGFGGGGGCGGWRGIWGWLWFSCRVGHGAGGLVSVIQGFAAGGPWTVILSDLGTFLVFCNFLRS